MSLNLDKYLSSGSKKRRKKVKEGSTKKFKGGGMRIVDDDGFSFGNRLKGDSSDDDETRTAEDLPQIAAVVDERPREAQLEDEFKQGKWKTLSTVKSPSSSPRARRRHDSGSSGDDLSPPRRRHDSDDDMSPPRQKRHDSDDDSAPSKSKRRRNGSEDLSPPRNKRRHDSDDDLSPPRPSQRQRKRQDSDGDLSPPRGKKRHDSGDLSPPRPRQGKRRESDDLSPPRARKRVDSDVDLSPPRPRRRYDDLPPPKGRRGRDSDDLSPPRYSGSSRGSGSRRPIANPEIIEDPKGHVQGTTLEGKKAGLQRASDLRNEMVDYRKKENEMFANLDDEVSGRNAVTKMRDRTTGRERDFTAELAKKEEDDKKAAERKLLYDKWGKGLKQVEARSVKVDEALHEVSKPLARYADDQDLDAYLKQQDRDGDPMLKFMTRKKVGPSRDKPAYQGPPPLPNRFGIPPGCRWDGVDRSNGYEKDWFSGINARKALKEEAYKWSVEDL